MEELVNKDSNNIQFKEDCVKGEEEYKEFNIDNMFEKKDGVYQGYIKDDKVIASLYNFLINKNATIVNKYKIVSILIEQFYNYPLLIDLICSTISNGLNLSEVLISLYINIIVNEREMSSEEQNNFKLTILELISVINYHIDIPRKGYAIVYNHLAKYYRKELVNINERELISILKLLSVLYGNEEYLKKEKIKEIQKNYFYFNGDSLIHSDSINLFKIDEWTAVFLIKIENNTFKQYKPTILIEVLMDESSIKLSFENEKLFLSFKEEKICELINCPMDQWIIVKLSLSQKGEYILRINGINYKEKEASGKINNYKYSKIKEIYFLRDFVGLVFSLFFFDSNLDNDYFKKCFFNEEDFLKIIIKKGLQFILLPEYYNYQKGKIDCKINIINGQFVSPKPIKSIHFINEHVKKVELVGGINNLLPILEIIYTSKFQNEETFISFLFVCHIIISKSFSNLYTALENNFFQCLSIFIQRFPSSLFTERVFEQIMQIHKDCIFLLNNNKGSSFNNEVYIVYKYLFLNENIILKFSFDNQKKLWNQLINYLKDDSVQLEIYIKSTQLCNILSVYEENRYTHFCCEKHKNTFDKNSNLLIMNPPLDLIYKEIEEFILLFLIRRMGEKSKKILNLLFLDISPCLRRTILSIIKKLVENPKNTSLTYNLLLNQMENPLIFSFIIGNIDIKVNIIGIFISIMKIQSEALNLYFSETKKDSKIWMEDILPFFEGNLFYHLELDNIQKSKIIFFLNKKQVQEELSRKKSFSQIPIPRRNLIIKNSEDYSQSKTDIHPIKKKNTVYDKLNQQNQLEVKKGIITKAKKKIADFSYNIWNKISNPFKRKVNKASSMKENNKLNTFDFKNLIEEININYKEFHSENQRVIIKSFSNYDTELFKSEMTAYFNNLISFFFDSEYILTFFTFPHDLRLLQNFLSFYTEPHLMKTFLCKFKNILPFIEQKDFITSKAQSDILVFNWFFDMIFHFKMCKNFIWYEEQFVKADESEYTEIINKIIAIYSEMLVKMESDLKIIILNSFFNLGLYKRILFEIHKDFYSIKDVIDESLREFLVGNLKDFNKQKKNINTVINNNRPKSIEFKKKIKVNSSLKEYDYITEFLSLILEYILIYNLEHHFYKDLNGITMENNNAFPIIFLSSLRLGNYISNSSKILNSKEHKLLTKSIKFSLDNIISMSKFNHLFSEDYKSSSDNNKVKFFQTFIDKTLEYSNNFIKDITFLLQKKYENPMVITILNFFTIQLTISTDEIIADFWTQQNLHYIFFIILCCTLPPDTIEGIENLLKAYFIPVILYSIKFFFLVEKTDKIKSIYNKSLKMIFLFCACCIQKVEREQKKNVLLNNPLYFLFNSILIDENGRGIINLNIKEILDIDKDSSFFERKQKLFSNLKSRKINECLKVIFNQKYYIKLTNQRFSKLCQIIPLYNYSKLFKLKRNIFTERFKLILTNDIVSNKLTRMNNAFIGISNDFLNKCYLKKAKAAINDLKVKKMYKKQKKKLFSWREMWSDKDNFYINQNKIKQKIMMHYSSNFSLPLIVPILDIDNTHPDFSHFDMNNLFIPNENELKYKINLDIDSILGKDKIANTSNVPIKENYLYKAYKSLFNGALWKEYEKIKTKDAIGDLDSQLSTTYFHCCLLKQTRHIYGKISIKSDSIIFIHQKDPQNYIKNFKFYDNIRQTCYGSIFKSCYKDKYFLPITIKQDEITYIFYKSYFFIERAVEIFTKNNKGYYFIFENNSERENFTKLLDINKTLYQRIITSTADQQGEICLGLIKGNDKLKLSKIIEKWEKRQMSSFDLLLWCNMLSSRSYKDLLQYPIFPWTIKKYDQLKLDIKEHKRDFNTPMGMMALSKEGAERRDNYIKNYKEMKNNMKEEKGNYNYTLTLNKESKNYVDMNNIPYHFGSHYSNPLYVCNYLIRLIPFSFISLELQGNSFDNPNRLFKSIPAAFKSASSQKMDVREVLPEFFQISEIFYNINNLNLKVKEGNDVILPPFANGKGSKFVIEMKNSLEDIDADVNKWIDLIFGYKQRGKKAEEAGNVFIAQSYYIQDNEYGLTEGFMDTDFADLLITAEIGITPHQIWFKKFPEKYSSFKDKTIQLSYTFPEIKSNNIPIALFVKEYEFTILLNSFELIELKVKDGSIINVNNNDKEIYLNMNNANEIITTLGNASILKGDNLDNFLILFENSWTIAMGGFYQGMIMLIKKNSFIQYIYPPFDDKSLIVCLEKNKKETFMFSGNKKGSVVIYTLDKDIWTYYKRKNDHDREITSIKINDELNVFATTALDGYIMIYTFPQCDLIRSINLNIDNNVTFFTPNILWISHSPIPSVVVFEKETNEFRSYSINGTAIDVQKRNKIEIEDEEKEVITSSVIVNSNKNFADYLIVGNNKGQIEIFEIPLMKIIGKFKVFRRGNDKKNGIKFIKEINKGNQLLFVNDRVEIVINSLPNLLKLIECNISK